MVCTGERCTAFFTKVTFNACTLGVCNGAQVTLKGPSFEDMAAAAAGLSIFAHGKGTTVRVQGGSIHGGTQGVTVQDGARFQASGLSVTNFVAAGLQVQGKGSRMLLTSCKVHELTPCLENCRSDGVLVQAGGSAQLKQFRMSACGDGVVAEHQGSYLEAEGCTFEENSVHGVLATDAAEVLLRCCPSSENGDSGFVTEHKARLKAIGCSASSCIDTGFAVLCGARCWIAPLPRTTTMGCLFVARVQGWRQRSAPSRRMGGVVSSLQLPRRWW